MLNEMTIGKKITIGFSVILFLLIFVGFAGYNGA